MRWDFRNPNCYFSIPTLISRILIAILEILITFPRIPTRIPRITTVIINIPTRIPGIRVGILAKTQLEFLVFQLGYLES